MHGLEKGIAQFDLAIEPKPSRSTLFAYAYVARRDAYRRLEQPEKAPESLEAAIAKYPKPMPPAVRVFWSNLIR